jgi:DNA-binding PadR family transcriptional regulator
MDRKRGATGRTFDTRGGAQHHRGRGHGHFGEHELFEEARRLGGHGGRGRPLGQGDLRLLVLQLLSERPRHGYDLIRAVEELTGGAYAPSPGIVYPTLTLLEELGYAEVAESEGAKKQYALTAQGREELKAHEPEVQVMVSRLARLAEATTGAVDPEVLRASQNVSRSLFLRPGRKPWTSEQAKRVAEILDRAAAEIEQI